MNSSEIVTECKNELAVEKSLNNILCLWNRRSDSCCEVAGNLVSELKKSGRQVAESVDEFDAAIDLVFLLGGDGWQETCFPAPIVEIDAKW